MVQGSLDKLEQYQARHNTIALWARYNRIVQGSLDKLEQTRLDTLKQHYGLDTTEEYKALWINWNTTRLDTLKQY